MEYLHQESAWYTSPQGINAYEKLRTLDEKTIFVYAYLQKLVHSSFSKDNTCFRLALFLADAVAEANLPYSTYPALVDPKQNPFLAYVVNLNKHPGNKVLYYGLMAILHKIADPAELNSWIYDLKLMDSDDLQDRLIQLEHNFYDEEGPHMPNPLAFEIEEELETLQLKLMWFFRKK